MFLFRFIGKLIRFIIKTIFIVVMVAIILTVSGYVLVRETLDFDPYDTIKYSCSLADPVDVTTLSPNAFTSEDMAGAYSGVNSVVPNMITYSQENGYVVTFENLSKMNGLMALSDKQLGALAQQIISQEGRNTLTLGGRSLAFEIVQIDVLNLNADNSSLTDKASVNFVIKVDITSIKSSLSLFPLKYLGEALPDYVYVSSTVLLEVDETGFSYTLSHQSLTVNNFDDFKTEDFFRSLDVLMKTGTVEDFGIEIADAILGALVGNEQQNGVVYSLKNSGAKGFAFAEINDVQYLLIVKN